MIRVSLILAVAKLRVNTELAETSVGGS
jgi:hypothetical protein